MRSALIVVDMLKDNLQGGHSVARAGRALIPRINSVISACRKVGMPIIFACDSFLLQDFLFKSRLKPHCIRGTQRCQVVEELDRSPGDLVVEKRRLSAFFKTDLDQTLRTLGVDTVVLCGITAPYCVLTTALDAVSHDFYAVILRDCTASHDEKTHQAVMEIYGKGPLYPLLRVMDSGEFLEGLKNDRG